MKRKSRSNKLTKKLRSTTVTNLYYSFYSMRGPTYVWTSNLKTKDKPTRWTLAGVALLLGV